MNNVIDYTTMRKGSKPYGRRITVCPKCGRKGEESSVRTSRDGLRHWQEWHHRATDTGLFRHITDHCHVPSTK